MQKWNACFHHCGKLTCEQCDVFGFDLFARAHPAFLDLCGKNALAAERGRAEGTFRGGVDPLQLYVSIAGLSYFYLSNNHTLSAIFGRDLMTPKARSERLSHMCEVILGYVLMS